MVESNCGGVAINREVGRRDREVVYKAPKTTLSAFRKSSRATTRRSSKLKLKTTLEFFYKAHRSIRVDTSFSRIIPKTSAITSTTPLRAIFPYFNPTSRITSTSQSQVEMENGTVSQGEGKDPSGFLSEIIGSSVTVKLNSGVVYKGVL